MLELDGRTLSPEQVARAARTPEPVSLGAEARARNEAGYRRTLELFDRGAEVYGLSTGVGALRKLRVDPQTLGDHQLRLLRSHAGGAGEGAPPEVGRALLLVRANQIAAGGAGVHPGLLDALVQALNDGAAPRVPEIGSLGTGDLTALAALGLAILGERPLAGAPAPAVRPPLGPRDGLMLMSSNAHTIAEAALCDADLGRLARAAEACAALSFDAASANLSALDERVHAARPPPGQVAVADRLRHLLEGYTPLAPRLQDSYAFRCLPQVHGVLRDAEAHLRAVVTVELNASAENPLLCDDGALANGNFHSAPLAMALDHVRNAIAQVASLSAARLSDLMLPDVTGLHPFLAAQPGPDSGLMILEYTANAAVGEVSSLATPTTQSVFVSHGVENHASFAQLAARRTSRAIELLRTIVAAELVAATRAVRMRARPPSGLGALRLFETAAVLPADTADRPLSDDLEAAARLLREQEFS